MVLLTLADVRSQLKEYYLAVFKDPNSVMVCEEPRDGIITHGQRGTNRPPPGDGGYELWVKGPNLVIMAKVSHNLVILILS